MQHVVYIYSLRLPPLADSVASQYLSTPIFQRRSHLHANIETNESKAMELGREAMIDGETLLTVLSVLGSTSWPLQLFFRLGATPG